MNKLEDFFERIISVKWGPGKQSVDILDQTLLPREEKRIQLRTSEEMWEAIHSLRVRGAPAIGVFAAYSAALLAQSIEARDYTDFSVAFSEISQYLASSRPTAVNLSWALHRLARVLEGHKEQTVADLKAVLIREAESIREEDVAISRRIGSYGLDILSQYKQAGKPLGVLTHCNAGTLATAKYGTATAPLYMALEAGWSAEDFRLYCDETRPLLQGARLTAYELEAAGFPTTLQCDAMSSVLMAQGKIDLILVGCDRVAANGDAANKIGTNNLAIVAKHYGVPFYVCAPSSTLDLATPTGAEIPIEMRAGDEVTAMWYKQALAPSGIEVFNPAFDVTDHSLITGLITDQGVCLPPYEPALQQLITEKV